MIDIQILSKDHVKELMDLISVFEDVFEMKNFTCPAETYLSSLLQTDHFFAVTAKHESQVVGGLTVYILDQYYSTKPLAYIFDLAVLKEFQRKGIGRKLIEFTKNYCARKGFEEAFVQADKVDDYAIDFYRLTNPTEELEAVHFSYLLSKD